jgi:dCMP deaminase
VIVDEYKRIVATGYNGLPCGVDDSFWPTERTMKIKIVAGSPDNIIDNITKYDVMTHAEVNAITSAGRSLRGCTLYCNFIPCNQCAIVIITAGIKRVVAATPCQGWAKAHVIAEELFKQAGVKLEVAGGHTC